MSEAARVLESAGVPAEDSGRDASLLARWILEWDEAAWLTRRQQPLPAGFGDRFAGAIARRTQREPLAYILGEREFYGHPFRVSSAVLIPRPETELIVDEALARLATNDDATVVDVGTGSGCLAVTIAVERLRTRVIAVDVSPAALAVARDNARHHHVLDRVECRQGNLLERIAPVEMIVSNPPYVPDTDRASLSPEVRDYEPAGALFAGPDGLDVIRALLPAATRSLVPGGVLIFEFGWEQADAVTRLVQSTPGLTLLDVRRDLQGIPRVAIAQHTAAPVR